MAVDLEFMQLSVSNDLSNRLRNEEEITMKTLKIFAAVLSLAVAGTTLAAPADAAMMMHKKKHMMMHKKMHKMHHKMHKMMK